MSNTRLQRNTAYFIAAQVLNRGSYAALLVALTYLFGIGANTDVFFVALTIPMMVVSITMDGCFVTVLRALSKTEREDQRWAVVGQSLLLFATVYSAIAVAVAACASEVVRLTAPGLQAESRNHAIELLRLAATMIPAQGIGQVVGSTLIHRERVAAGAWRPAVVSMLSVVVAFGGAALLGARVGVFLGGMVAGVWIGNLAYLIYLLKDRSGFRLEFRFRRQITEIFISALVNSGNNVPTNVALLVERGVATFFGPGALSAINLARTCLNLVGAPAAAAANSTFVEAVMLPAVTSDREVGRHRAGMLYGPLFISTPILALLTIDSLLVVAFLFEHGHAGVVNAAVVARILLILVASFPFLICSTGLLRMYQAAYLDKWYLTVLSVGTAIYAAAAIGFGRRWGVEGLAGIYSVSFDLITATLVGIAVRRLGRDVVALPWLRWLVAASCSLLLLLLRGLLPSLRSPLAELLLDSSVAVIAYLGAGWVVDLPGVRVAGGRILRWTASRATACSTRRME
jgi:peptidoglycan biosynthesis protein MviN/MurJ (putative lipid II flippase)